MLNFLHRNGQGPCFAIFSGILPLFLLLCLSPGAEAADRIWTGAGNDGQWNNPANWENSQVPSAADDVILDNTYIGTNFTVTLPAVRVIVKTLTIRPSSNLTIQLLLPSSNIVDSALVITGPGYGLLLERGGVFMNASGLASGEALAVADSIRINNGGKYVHHTRASHANNIVRLLSAAPGTELGVFEFDVPRASYTISASNRKYGTLVFRAVAAGGTANYTCNGSNPLTVNGNLQIEAGVSFSVDLGGPNGNIIIRRDYIQNGGTFNVASGAGNSTRVSVSGNMIQSAGAQITESNTGLPSIELNGSATQIISLGGSVLNSIAFAMNNPEGAILLSPLQLPYALVLRQGRILTTEENLLTLLPNCSVAADSSIYNTSYVDGPLRKLGLAGTSHFLFPVGKNGSLRWLALKNASGNFQVEYMKMNPRSFSQQYGPGIDHVSAQEYWKINTDSGARPEVSLELSFLDPGSGGITELSTLRVAALDTNTWVDEGQSATTGATGSAGSVVSRSIFQLPARGIFTLASSVNLDNPLPVRMIQFSASVNEGEAHLHWVIDLPGDPDRFEVLCGRSPDDLKQIHSMQAFPGETAYDDVLALDGAGTHYFAIKIREKNGLSYMSRVISVREEADRASAVIFPSIVHTNAWVKLHSEESTRFQWMIVSMDGKEEMRGSGEMAKGETILALNIGLLPAGHYLFAGIARGKRIFLLRFIKMK